MGYAEIIVPKPCNSSEDGLYCRCTRNVITHQESECNEEMKTIYEEVKRLKNPHEYYVDGTEEYINLKNRLIRETKQKILK